MPNNQANNFAAAIDDFHRARQRAAIKEVLARFTGEPIGLLSYDDVRKKLKAYDKIDRGLQDIPLDAIVGSVNRYEDFTRDFLPKQSSLAERWARVELGMVDLKGLPPIEVYQMGEVYFVRDGNHRVSVARQLGATYIQAYVIEVQTRTRLEKNASPDDVILKGEYGEFLEHTQLDKTRPEADLTVTAPGKYALLEEHISVHRYYMGIEQDRFIPYEEAAADWYDNVYRPIRDTLREKNLLQHFQNRTETDLYLWIAEHRAYLEEQYDREIRLPKAVEDLAEQHSSKPARKASRFTGKLLNKILPDSLVSGPSVGVWRKERLSSPDRDRLFSDILVPVSKEEHVWQGLEFAIEIAKREEARLYGLHVYNPKTEDSIPTQEEINELRESFAGRCEAEGVAGKLVVDSGESVTGKICDHARWSDLVVTTLAYPPSSQPLAALSSGYRMLIQHCPRPILAVPVEGQMARPVRKVLLAYDGSPKAQEALFVSAYLAGSWKVELEVITVIETSGIGGDKLEEAQRYLEGHQIRASYMLKDGDPADVLISLSHERNHDLLLMGGYGHGPILDIVIGDTIGKILRKSDRPILICR